MLDRFSLRALVLASLLLPLASCSVSPSLSLITVTPATMTFGGPGLTTQLTAIGTYTQGSHPATTRDITNEVTWTSSTPGAVTVSNAGLITSVASCSNIPITASAPGFTGIITGSMTVNVTGSGSGSSEPLVSLAIVPATQSVLALNQSVQFYAIGTLSSGATVDLTSSTWTVSKGSVISAAAWSSSNTSVAQFLPANASTPGLVTSVGGGSTTITARAENPDGTAVTATATFTVTVSTATEPYVSLAIVPASQTATSVNQPVQYVAIGTTGTGTTVDLTPTAIWGSSSSAVAKTGTNPGQFIAVGSGIVAITAKVLNPGIGGNPADGTSVSASALMSVNISATHEPLLSTTIYPGAPSVASPGLTSQLADIGTFSSVPITQDVTAGIASYPITTSWSSSTPAVATVTTVCPTGLTALSCTISACPGTSNAGVCTSCTGGTVASGASCATLNPTTPVGLITGLSQGTTAIMAVSSNPDGSQVIASVPFSVTGGSTEQVTALTIIPSSISATSPAQKNQLIALGTEGTLQYDVTSQVVWKSNTPTVASICTAGDPLPCTAATDGLVTAATAGSTIITATWTNLDKSQVVAQATYSVTIGASPEPLISINVVPPSVTVSNKGMTQQYLAFGTFTTIPTLRDITDSVTWITLDPNLVSINSEGTPGEVAGLATAMGYEGLGVIYAEGTNPDNTIVLSNAVTFTCQEPGVSPPVCDPDVAPALLATLTVFNAGSNDTNWLITAPSDTGVPNLIHCGPGSEIAGLGNSVCTGTYAAGTDVTITASLAGGTLDNTFGGWTANCDTIVDVPNMTATCTLPTPSNPMGTGYTTAAGLPTSTNGVGSGAVISITALAGNLTSCTATTPGSGYIVGDLVYPTQAGATGSSCLVEAVSGTGGVSMMAASIEASGDPSGLVGDQSVGALFYGLTLSCSKVTSDPVGTAFPSNAITVTNGTTPYTFSVVGTLPTGLALNTSTGAVTGTPTAAGSFSITATDANGTTAGSACAITIN